MKYYNKLRLQDTANRVNTGIVKILNLYIILLCTLLYQNITPSTIFSLLSWFWYCSLLNIGTIIFRPDIYNNICNRSVRLCMSNCVVAIVIEKTHLKKEKKGQYYERLHKIWRVCEIIIFLYLKYSLCK